jgi:hypothetical protein
VIALHSDTRPPSLAGDTNRACGPPELGRHYPQICDPRPAAHHSDYGCTRRPPRGLGPWFIVPIPRPGQSGRRGPGVFRSSSTRILLCRGYCPHHRCDIGCRRGSCATASPANSPSWNGWGPRIAWHLGAGRRDRDDFAWEQLGPVSPTRPALLLPSLHRSLTGLPGGPTPGQYICVDAIRPPPSLRARSQAGGRNFGINRASKAMIGSIMGSDGSCGGCMGAIRSISHHDYPQTHQAS